MRSKLFLIFVGLFSLLCSPLSAGHLKVNIAPAQAVSAGAQWQVDGGPWKNSGATVKNLSNTNHQVSFKTVTGWITPAPLTVAITGNNTTTLNVTYLQTASLRVDLTPSSGQWRVDGGAWRASGTTITGLTPGSHQVEYAGLSGYATPASENVSLTGGQTTTLIRNYTQLAQLSVTLSPSSGQWRVDGGPWQVSGSTVANLAPGAHTLSYASLTNYASPAAESVSLTTGQSLALTRSYVQLADVSINLVPATGQWRVDSGAWQTAGATLPVLPGDHSVEYAPLANYDPPQNETITVTAGSAFTATRTYTSQKPSLQINLTPNTGQWRIDGGAWQASGSVVVGLDAGTHTVDYSDIGGTYNPLPSESVSLALRERATLARSYPVKPLAAVHVTINPSWANAQWRIDGGAWQDANTSIYNLAYGVPHTIEYSTAEGFVAPPSETVTLSSGELRSVYATYTPLASLYVILNPSWVTAQWRIDGGPWQNSGSTVYNLAYGVPHTIEYSAAEGFVAPPSETVTLSSGELRSVYATYTPLASLYVILNPSWVTAQWRIDGGLWQNSGSTVYNLAYGVPHTIEYSAAEGFVAPPSETVTLSSGELRSIYATYTPQPVAAFTITDIGTLGGDSTYATAINLSGSITGFSYTTGGAAMHAFRYTNGIMEDLGTLGGYNSRANGINDAGTVVGTSNTADGYDRGFQFKDGEMQMLPNLGGTVSEGYAINNHGTIVGFAQNSELAYHAYRYRNGVMEDLGTLGGRSSLAMGLNEADVVVGMAMFQADSSQFRAFVVGEGAMQSLGSLGGTHSQANGINEAGIIVGSSYVAGDATEHIFRYQDGMMTDLGAPNGDSSDARAYGINESGTIVGTSISSAEVGYQAFVSSNGVIQNLNTLVDLPGVTLTDAVGPNNLGQIAANGSNGHAYLLTPINSPGGIQITLNPVTALWRIDGGAWQTSDSPVLNLAVGNHIIEYSAAAGYASPPTETVTVSSGRLLKLDRTYTALP